MMNLVNNLGGQTQQVRQNPDEYAKVYAEQNGLSVEEAKAELKSKYGDPQEQNGISSIGSLGNYNNYSVEDIQNIQDEIQGLEEKLFGTQENNSFLSSFMNFFNGVNSQDIINPETGTVTGPQKEGDFQFSDMRSFGKNNGVNGLFQQFYPQMGMSEEYKNIFN